MTAAQANLMIAMFEGRATLDAIASHFGMTKPVAALALCRALQARADRFALEGC